MSQLLLLGYPITGSITDTNPPFSGTLQYNCNWAYLIVKIENIFIEKNVLKFSGNIEDLRVITTQTYRTSGSYDATSLSDLNFINSGSTYHNDIIYYVEGEDSISRWYSSFQVGNVTLVDGQPMPYDDLQTLLNEIGNLSTNYIYDTLFPIDKLSTNITSLLESTYSGIDFSLLNLGTGAYDDSYGLSFAQSLVSNGYGVKLPTITSVYSTVGMPESGDKETDSDYATTPDNIDEVPKPDVVEDGAPTSVDVSTTIFDALLTGNTAYYLLNTGELNKFWELFWGIPDIQTILLNSLTGMFDSLSKCVLGVQLYPFDMRKYYNTVTSAPVVGRYVLETNLPRITSSKQSELDMGSFDFGTYNGNQKHFGTKDKPHFLDYAPYTKFELYLPFVNNVIELDTNLWQHSTLNITLSVDLTTGRGLYKLKRNTIPLQFIDCKVGVDVPFVLDDMISTVSNATKGIVKGAATGNAMEAIGNINFPPLDIHSEISDSTAYLASLRARVTISQPIPRYPKSFARTIGYKTFTTKNLEDVSGFAIIDNPVLNMSDNMTLQEYDMIVNKLKEGVYL